MAASFLALLKKVSVAAKNASLAADDVSIMTQKAIKQTGGVIGDDLALNAQALHGLDANQELKVVYAVGKGGLINKMILIPSALAISYFFPSLIIPLLMIGGTYLCYEGVEKLLHKILHSEKVEVSVAPIEIDERIRSAIKTDFILSAEIIVIALGSMADAPIMNQIMSLTIVGLAMNFGVYGFVALIIKLDDMGLHLEKKSNKLAKATGFCLNRTTPLLMKSLGTIGTIAMFLVGGGIIAHGIPFIGHGVDNLAEQMVYPFSVIFKVAADGVVGVATGLIAVGVHYLVMKIKRK